MTTATQQELSVRRLTTHLGATVTGIDLREPLSPSRVDELRSLLLDNKVLFFTGQQLDTDQQIQFASYFGELTSSHPVVSPLDDDYPQVWQIDSQADVRNDVWHTDITFVPTPPLGSVLRAIQVPEYGSDTNWADLEAAYNSLSAPVQRLVDGLTAFHDGSREFEGVLARRNGKGNVWDGQVFTDFELVEHPVVRVHPETGRKALFVSPGFTVKIKGVSDFESRAILDLLFAHITKPEHIVRHHWTAGDIAVWDNRNTAHYANLDYGDFHRVMQRVVLKGDRPFGPSF